MFWRVCVSEPATFAFLCHHAPLLASRARSSDRAHGKDSSAPLKSRDELPPILAGLPGPTQPLAGGKHSGARESVSALRAAYRVDNAMEIALYHTLGRLPELEDFTHRFCWRGPFRYSLLACDHVDPPCRLWHCCARNPNRNRPFFQDGTGGVCY